MGCVRHVAAGAGLITAGLIAGTVTPVAAAPATIPPGRPAAHAAPAACPGGSSARTRGPGAPEPNTYTPEEAERLDRELRRARLRLGRAAPRGKVTVPVALHVITGEDGTGSVATTRLVRQVRAMNRAYGGDRGGVDTGFRFRFGGVDVTRDDRWFRHPDRYQRHMKRELREGGPETLNIYTADLGGDLLGWATLPQRYRRAPELDGVVVDHRSLPGGAFEDFDLGHTAVHETGHWLALFHTFQNGCERPGDRVSDTPYERVEAKGCPEGRDTCPGRGDDPVHNFMDYSADSCMTAFTRGQATRMRTAWTAFRADPR